MVARLIKEKGVVEFIEAAKKFKHGPQASFTLVGGLDINPGSLTEDELQFLLKDSSIEWVGKVDDVKPYLQKCDVFVLPSYREGLPKSTQEALAMGKAILTTDVPGCRETVLPFENGLLVKPKDVVSLYEGMLYFLKNRDQISPMGLKSREIAEKNFDVKIQTDKLTEYIIH